MRALLLALLLPLAACSSDDTTTIEAPEASGAEAPAPSVAASDDPTDTEPVEASTSEAAPAEPAGPNEAELEADADAEYAARTGSGQDSVPYQADIIDGDWMLEVGPAESVTFETGDVRGAGTVRFYMNDRLSESGTFSVAGTRLIITSNGVASGTYTLSSKSEEELIYTGGSSSVGDEATMLLTRIVND